MISQGKVASVLLKIFIILCCTSIVLIINFPSNEISIHSATGEGQIRLDIVVVGQGRSGTTFLGELLNQHPDIMYVFEPLHVTTGVLSGDNKSSRQRNNILFDKEDPEYKEEAVLKLETFLACNITGKTKYLQELASIKLQQRRSRVLAKIIEKGKVLTARFQHLCKHFKHRAVKILSGRLPSASLSSLEELVKNGLARQRQVKIIHVVRDPRAIVYSWTRYKWIKDYPDPDFYQNVQSICRPLKNNLTLRRHPPEWLQSRYMFVRYEDMVVQTKRVAQDIYNFLGIPIADEVVQWIESRKIKASSLGDRVNRHSTIRNASFVINNWKKQISKKKRKLIEGACSDVFLQLNEKI